MRCLTACFRTNCNHKKITIKPCNSSRNKINSISPQALQDLLETNENSEASISIDDTKDVVQHEVTNSINFIEESKDIKSRENLLGNGEASVSINAKQEKTTHKIANPINLFEESKDEEDGELNKNNRKNLLEIDEDGEAFVAINTSTKEESKTKEEEELNISSSRKKVTFDLNVSFDIEMNELSNSSVSSYISYDPPNHRYHCCRNSVDEFEDIDLEDDANNNNNGNEMNQEESSYESLFSLSIDSTRRRNNNPSSEMEENKEVNSPFKQSIKFSAKDQISQLSVLNPIQCKAGPITTPASPLKMKNHEKENIDMNLFDFNIAYNNRVQKEASLKHKENEIAVDTSLSSWLVEPSEDDNNNIHSSVGNSPSERTMKFDDRSILGELTDEKKPIMMGTVGSYLRHTGQATTVYPNYGISSC